MRISTNWLNDYVDLKNENLRDVALKITKAGVNVEGILNAGLNNLVIGQVKSVSKHPDSDHLNVCMVDLGTETKQIVCGAANVKEGIKVIVALEGAVLPGGFAIQKTVIRGVESNGMICALFELGLESKEENYQKGIHILPDDVQVGEDAVSYLGLDDTVYDLDLNPNRSDCLSHLGFAYETAAVLNKELTLPKLESHPISESIEQVMKIKVETDNCPMYRAKIVKNVVIKESPDFIKQRLTSAGMRPINNVVDISNYIMLEYGQPLHFFDQDKLGNQILVRMALEGEKIVTLDHKERTLKNTDIVITDGDKPVCIAGVMGGLNSDVDGNTKTILIESAIFSPYHVRYTSINLDLRSEASLRYEKGLNYEYTIDAMKRACYLLETYADGEILSGELVHDVVDKTPKVASVTRDKINKVLGMELSHQDIMDSFERLNFPVTVEDETYTVTIPNRCMDIAIKEDLIEEVGRLYGYDKIIAKLPIGSTKPGGYREKASYRKAISKRMRALGLNEVRTYTLVSKEDSEKFAYQTKERISLLKPMSADKSMLRESLIPSLINVCDYNLARHTKDIMIYEISNVYAGSYEEETKLGILMLGDYLGNAWQGITIKVDFYVLKGIIENLLNYLGLSNRYSFRVTNEIPTDMHPGMSAEIIVNNEAVGYFGKVHPKTHKESIYVAELNLNKLMTKKVRGIKFKELSKYPSVHKDVAFIVSKDVASEELISVIKKTGGKKLVDVTVFDVYTGENVGSNEKSIAYALTFCDPTKTLNDEEVTQLFNQIIDAVCTKCKAVLRDK